MKSDPVNRKNRKPHPNPRVLSGMKNDPVNHPKHYTKHPSGVECIQVTEHMSFCIGNAMKYLWRADLKNDAIEDLEKARWYIAREIERRKK
jgi:hypothetical protein